MSLSESLLNPQEPGGARGDVVIYIQRLDGMTHFHLRTTGTSERSCGGALREGREL